MRRLVDLSHPIRMGQVTHPGLPGPGWEGFRSREDYRRSTGTEFQVDRVVLVGNTGTYLDSPFHRFPGGDDPARPAHTVLRGQGILVLEHLTGLAGVPPRGARLHAAPPAWHGVGTWPVRAYAVVEEDGT